MTIKYHDILTLDKYEDPLDTGWSKDHNLAREILDEALWKVDAICSDNLDGTCDRCVFAYNHKKRAVCGDGKRDWYEFINDPDIPYEEKLDTAKRLLAICYASLGYIIDSID